MKNPPAESFLYSIRNLIKEQLHKERNLQLLTNDQFQNHQDILEEQFARWLFNKFIEEKQGI